MVPVFTVLFVLAVSLIVVRVATVGLTMTGISRDLAQFQALSAFTGSGFTTRESEDIVNHPVRRRIVMHLMLLGNAGIVIAIASLLPLFLYSKEPDDWYDHLWFRLTLLATGIVILWFVANSRFLEEFMWRVHTWALRRWTKVEVRDYMGLLRLAHDYAVSELRVQDSDWVAGKTLGELQLTNEGILVLGIECRDGRYLGSPRGKTSVHSGDCLVLYGRRESLLELDNRRAGFEGNAHHMIAITRQMDIQVEEGRTAEGE